MKIERKTKDIIISILFIALLASGIGNLYLSFNFFSSSAPLSRILVMGSYNSPYGHYDQWALDPIKSWPENDRDKRSRAVIDQVCEGLFTHNLSDPNLKLVPCLALNYGTWNVLGTSYTVPLRQNVTFHDGTPFNAEAVKWNFERLSWFMNGTGALNETLSPANSIWNFPNGTFILNQGNPVSVNNEYSVTFNLKAPYAILESLLCHVSAFILSPESTPKYEYIHDFYGRIVGTGPFVYDYYVADKEVKFHRWDNYWRKPAFFEKIYITFIDDYYARSEAMLSHTVDYLNGAGSTYMSAFDADSTITHKSEVGLSYYYLGMNNININKTWRRAITYALNWSIAINVFLNGDVHRSNGPLAPNFPDFNPTIHAASYNLTKAREIVVGMGYGDMSWTDAQWQDADFIGFNYTYRIGNKFREDLVVLLQDSLDLIGIEIWDRGLIWADFIPGWTPPPFPFEYYETQNIYMWAEYPDYLSPYNMISKLFSNKSSEYTCRYYNHTVEMWLEEVLKETDSLKREQLYTKILHQIVEVDMPHLFAHHYNQHFVHSADILGVPYNSMGSFYAYPMYRIHRI